VQITLAQQVSALFVTIESRPPSAFSLDNDNGKDNNLVSCEWGVAMAARFLPLLTEAGFRIAPICRGDMASEPVGIRRAYSGPSQIQRP
jgi:hypothetical protein